MIDRLIAFARQRPHTVLLWVLGLHLLAWTVLPILVCANLQLDLAEDLALGKEWQLGYWKHPPLPWWLADLAYRLTGQIDSIYLLGPLAAVVCMYGVWLLARETIGPFEGLVAVLALEGVHFYNFSVVKFAHDQMQLPMWAFTALFFYRAIKRGRLLDWMLAGAFLAGAFWSKYAAFAFAATLGLFLLLDPLARKAWRTPGPYVMAAAFVVVLSPNIWWLVSHEFLPFQYVDARARGAERWHQYLSFPLRWIASQAFFLLPAAGLLALLYVGGVRKRAAADEAAAFDRRYLATLALGPFLVTTLVSTALGRLTISMWGYPLWSFAPLAALIWFAPAVDGAPLRRFATGFVAVFAAVPAIYAAVELGEPLVRDRTKATQFPGQALADAVTKEWRSRYGAPLHYVAGTEFVVNNIAVYSPDRPHVVVHAEPRLSPWIDMADLRRRGAVLAWEGLGPGSDIERLKATFGDIEMRPPLVLPRQTWRTGRPIQVNYAFIPPRP